MSRKEMMWATVIIVPIVFGLVLLMARKIGGLSVGFSIGVAEIVSVLSLVKAIIYMRAVRSE